MCSFLYFILDNVTEQARKKRKSISQFNTISNAPEYKEFYEEYIMMKIQLDDYVETIEKLLEISEKYQKLSLLFKPYVDMKDRKLFDDQCLK